MPDGVAKLSVSQVNHSPSFHTDAPLDKEVKEGLLYDTLNLIDLFANDRRRCQEEDKRRVQERLLRAKTIDARYLLRLSSSVVLVN